MGGIENITIAGVSEFGTCKECGDKLTNEFICATCGFCKRRDNDYGAEGGNCAFCEHAEQVGYEFKCKIEEKWYKNNLKHYENFGRRRDFK